MKKAEPFIFFLLIIIHAIPVATLDYFPTVDGPAHLYNSNLINSYFSSSSSVVREYFVFNAEPEPNWLGHALLCFFNLWLPFFLAEKLVILLYLISLPVFFRMYVKAISTDNIYSAYFIFPFIYTLLLYLGFYNFCLSISLLFLALYYSHTRLKNPTNTSLIIFAVILLLLYFAHLFSFLFFVAIQLYFFILKWSKEKKRNTRVLIIKNITPYALPIILSLNFILKKGGGGEYNFLPISTLLTWLQESAPVITLSHNNEYIYASLLTVLWLLLFAFVLWRRIKSESKFFFTDNWFLISLFILIAYFIFPDDAATGGFISLRILLYFFLFFIVWLSLQKLSKVIFVVAAVYSVSISLLLLNKHYIDSQALSSDVADLYSAVEHIEENKNVLPLNYSGNWLHANFSNYLGSEKNIIVLDNYEASKPHFPLSWLPNKSPYEVAGDFANSSSPCLTLDRYQNIAGIKIDYITRWYYNNTINDSCTILVNELLENKFKKIFVSPQQKMEVFKRIDI